MDAELKAKWVKALRSGEYEQTSGALRDKYRGGCAYCCLGVLAEVLGADWDRGVMSGGEFETISKEDEDLLSTELLALVCLTEEQQSLLAKMNDEGDGFPRIADYIEANL
jgi:hypothetical protein